MIRKFLVIIGLYNPIRNLYNFVFLFNATREVKFGDVIVRLRTPTFKIIDDVKSLWGEEEVLFTFLGKLQPEDVVWDIGASYGMYSLFVGKKFPSIKIYAFEPEHKTFKLLNKNIDLNGINNVIPMNFALGDIDGSAILHTSSSANIGTHSLVMRSDYPVSDKGISIEIRKGNSIVATGKVDSPTVVKIDVEGAELNVLKGMKEILSHSKPRLVQIEIHPKILPLFGSKPEDIYRLMNESKFKIAYRQERGTEVEVIFEK
jgi:FkbM family methyltransferase